MGSGIQTKNGKAFEYACVVALYKSLNSNQQVTIADSAQVETAKKLYDSISEGMKQSLDAAAYAAVRVIFQLEPQLWNACGNDPLYLSLQADAAGIKGDVRDVLCIRKQNGWEIGLSCKHNHHAVKHSRLSDTIDFGKEWLGIPCSKGYFGKVVPLFLELREMRDRSKEEGSPALWNDVEEKAERYYIPVLQAFIDELKRMDKENPRQVPELLIHYLLGKNDFYKVITNDKNRTTRVEAVNIMGTLNRVAGEAKSIAKIPVLKMPSQFYHIDFKESSNNTIEVVCDEGWQISMRLHNASSKVEPSLKFDVNLVSLPSSVYTQVEPWDNKMEEMRTKRLARYAKGILSL
ncbi:MAG TPA: HaeIII family restriction endonuclease [Lachnospiraceae bacterium]|nr:HaeIII family restriction endonuclease [Lachnospiraceae bacterium]